MIETTIKRGVTALALALAFTYAEYTSSDRAIASTDEQEASSQAAEQTIEQRYKNIQVLKGLPASQLRPMMNYISASLGVNCVFCHVREGDQMAFEKDDNNHKQIARRMIQMTMDINKNSFQGKVQVSCYTCGRKDQDAGDQGRQRRGQRLELPARDPIRVARQIQFGRQPAAGRDHTETQRVVRMDQERPRGPRHG